MKIRIKDIAEICGVSVGTVDRVIHNRGEVSSKTRKKVLSTLREVEYEPDIRARALASNRDFRIAALIPASTSDNKFWDSPLNGIHAAIKDYNYYSLVVDEYLYDQLNREDFQAKAFRMLAGRPDALIVASVFYKEAGAIMDQCTELDIPFVCINSNICHKDQLGYIGQDSVRSGILAGHIMSYGLDKNESLLIVNVAKSADNYSHITNREKGFIEYFETEGLDKKVNLFRIDIQEDNEKNIASVLDVYFEDESGIKGVFVTNSRVYKIARYLQKNGRKDVMLIGYDLIDPNIEFLKQGTIDFLISQNPEEQGYRGMVTLYNKMFLNKGMEAEQYMPIDIITRENLQYYNTGFSN